MHASIGGKNEKAKIPASHSVYLLVFFNLYFYGESESSRTKYKPEG